MRSLQARIRWAVFAVLVAVAALAAAPVEAHEFRAEVVTITALEDGRFAVHGDVPLELHDSACEARAEGEGEIWNCPDGLAGSISSPAVSAATQVYVRVEGEQPREFVLSMGSPRAELSRPSTTALASVAAGFVHILAGLDHLLVVLGLFVLLSERRARLIAITGFTVGHCLSLLAVALGGVGLPGPLVEAGIALSVAWIGVELAQAQAAALARRPLGVAAAIGLLHGLGFGGAIQAGPGQLWIVAGFNVGIELGQLAVLGVLAWGAWALRRGLGPFDEAAKRGSRLALGYALGVLGIAWAWERVLS